MSAYFAFPSPGFLFSFCIFVCLKNSEDWHIIVFLLRFGGYFISFPSSRIFSLIFVCLKNSKDKHIIVILLRFERYFISFPTSRTPYLSLHFRQSAKRGWTHYCFVSDQYSESSLFLRIIQDSCTIFYIFFCQKKNHCNLVNLFLRSYSFLLLLLPYEW